MHTIMVGNQFLLGCSLRTWVTYVSLESGQAWCIYGPKWIEGYVSMWLDVWSLILQLKSLALKQFDDSLNGYET